MVQLNLSLSKIGQRFYPPNLNIRMRKNIKRLKEEIVFKSFLDEYGYVCKGMPNQATKLIQY